jgi:hypothetical protein
MGKLHHHVLLLAGFAFLAGDRVAAADVRGVIASLDSAKKELRLEGRGAERRSTLVFALDDKTLVLFGVEKGSVADLQAGRRVRIEFELNDDGQRVARVIRATGRPPAAPVAAPAAPVMAAGDAVTGVLQRVARSDRELVVIGPGSKGPETESTIAVPETAKIVKEGKPASLESLKEGDTVAVRVESRGGRLKAVEVQGGAGATLSTPAGPERGKFVPRLRQALHVADEVLRRLDNSGGGEPAPKKP